MIDVNKLNDLRSYSIAAPYLMPLLARKKMIAIKKLVSDYRGEGKNLHAIAAEISILDDLENELKRKHIELQHMQEE